MIGTINDYATIINNTLKHIAPKVSPTVKSEYLDFMHKVGSSERIYSDVGVTGLGMAQIIPDGGIGASDAPIQGYSKNYTQMHFTKKVRLTFQTNFFLFESAAAKIKSSVKSKVLEGKNAIEHAKNYLSQSLLSQGFTTSFAWTPINGVGSTQTISTVGADAVEYWTQAHPREDGGTAWTNVIVDGATSSPQFTYSSLLAARRLHSLKKDGRGNPMISDLDTLICRRGSTTAQFAKTIKSTIDKGIAGGINPSHGKETYYQTECIQTLIQKFKEGKQKMLVHMATGLGKTRTMVAFTKALFGIQHGKKNFVCC